MNNGKNIKIFEFVEPSMPLDIELLKFVKVEITDDHAITTSILIK